MLAFLRTASLYHDLRFALRQLRKAPGFALTAVLTLALGIGTTTAIYSLIDGVLLRPLPLPHPEQLVAAYTAENRPGQPFDWGATSYPNYLDWRDRNHTFSQLAAYVGDARLISRANRADGTVLPISHVSVNYFDTLGVQPILGRNFAADEDQPGRHDLIISYGFWQRFYAADPHIPGTTILISDVPYTIIGVMPKGFIEPRADQAELWTNFSNFFDGSAPRAKDRDNRFAEIVGRLKPGMTQEQAIADLSTIQSSLAKTYPEDRYFRSVFLESKLKDLTGDMRPALLMLMAAVLAVLLIVCTNVAGLMLTRTLKRRGEIALRAALGASPKRIWQQILLESLLLGVSGGAIGIAIAYALLHIALPLVPDDIPRIGEVAIDGRVLAFTVVLSVVCALLSSLVPAWKLARVSPIESLREQSQSATSSRRTHHFQNTLVIAQTALGFALLLASGLLIRGFVNMRHAKLGFQADHLLRFMLPLTRVRYPDAKKALFYPVLLPKLAAIPGVRSASAGYPAPLHGAYGSAPVEIDGRPNPPDDPLTTLVGEAEPGYFETLGVPLLEGRNFTAADNDPKSPFVALVNQAFVKKYFPDVNPIGRHIRPDLSGLRNQAIDIDPASRNDREIIGVLADFQQTSVIDPPQPMAVFPYSQASMLMRPAVVLRVAGDPMQYEKPAQAALSSIDPFLFVLTPESMEMHISSISSTQRFETLLISAFASIALFLSGLGLYATLAAMVATRTREIGLRMAIGADRRDVASLILTRAALLVFSGLAIGTTMILIAARSLSTAEWWRRLLFGVSWFDPRTYFPILLVLSAVSLAACFLPTWRAIRVDPMRVLRDE
jgi:putative ABC transport system permease protein